MIAPAAGFPYGEVAMNRDGTLRLKTFYHNDTPCSTCLHFEGPWVGDMGYRHPGFLSVRGPFTKADLPDMLETLERRRLELIGAGEWKEWPDATVI